MPCSDTDVYTLDFWSFIRDYERDESLWAGWAWDVYQHIVQGGMNDIKQEDLERIFAIFLEGNKEFNARCERKLGIPRDMYPTMAQIFSRCVVDRNWSIINR